MVHLSVNVNKIATLRNSRGKDNPNLIVFTELILQERVQGITVHPRPDGRHIRYQDVFDLAPLLADAGVEFNIEGFPSADFIDLIAKIRPQQVTLVPDPPEALTSNAGWKLQENKAWLVDVVNQLKMTGARISLFIDPEKFDDGPELNALKEIGPHRIELYTEKYADAYSGPNQKKITQLYASAARRAYSIGVGVNAGHDLNQQNLGFLLEQVPEILEVSIGHALICDALMDGLKPTVRSYLKITSSSGPRRNP